MLSTTTTKLLFTAAFLLVLSACATTPYHIPVSNEAHNKIDSTNVTLGLNQEEIYLKFVRADSSAQTAQYGLLGALIGSAIDASINSSASEDAEKLAQPIKDAAIDVNFGKEMAAALNTEIASIKWLNANDAKILGSYNFQNTKNIVASSGSAAVLVIHPNYYVSPDANSFNIQTTVHLYPNNSSLTNIVKKERPDDDQDIIYRNNVQFTYSLPEKIGDKNQAAQEWAKNNGEHIKLALHKGISQTAKLIALDISKIAENKKPQQSGTTEETPQEIVLEKGDNYKVVRQGSGALYSSVN